MRGSHSLILNHFQFKSLSVVIFYSSVLNQKPTSKRQTAGIRAALLAPPSIINPVDLNIMTHQTPGSRVSSLSLP